MRRRHRSQRLLEQQNILLRQYNDFINAFTSCDALFLYDGRSTPPVAMPTVLR